MVVISSTQRNVILDAVRRMYTDVALAPRQEFHFPTGRPACEFVGYRREWLDSLPARVVESFAGVGNPFATEVIRPGDVVLDVGSGSGTDVFLASRLVGPTGRVYAVDTTPAMREKLQANLRAAGIGNVEVLEGDAESIPLPDAAVDVVTSNGVLNLVPDKARAFREVSRVLRAGGRVQIADIVLGRRASDACRSDPELWAECIVGATTEAAYVAHLREAGLPQAEVIDRFDYFARSSPQTREVAESLGAIAVVLRARKAPPGPAALEDDDSDASAAELAGPTLDPGAIRGDRLFDAGARSCGEVTPIVRREMREIAPGQVLTVRSEVSLAGLELLAWCRMTGHEFLGSEGPHGTAQLHHLRRRH